MHTRNYSKACTFCIAALASRLLRLIGHSKRATESNLLFNIRARKEIHQRVPILMRVAALRIRLFKTATWNLWNSAIIISRVFLRTWRSWRRSLMTEVLTINFNLFQVIYNPTRDTSLIDSMLTISPESVSPVLISNVFSDYKMLQVTLRVPSLIIELRHIKIRDYNKANYVATITKLDNFLND